MDLKSVGPPSEPSTTQPFSVASTSSADSTHIEIAGELDLATAGIMRAVLEAIPHETTIVYLDLARVSFIDCAGWASIASAGTVVPSSNCSIVITSASKQVKRLIELMNGWAPEIGNITHPHTFAFDGS